MKVVGLRTLWQQTLVNKADMLSEREIEERLTQMAKRATLAARRKELREDGIAEERGESIPENAPQTGEAG